MLCDCAHNIDNKRSFNMPGKYRALYYGLNKYVFSMLPDVLYHNLLGWIMHRRFGVNCQWMDIAHPKTFNEKLQWLKTHGDIALKSKLADKFDVRGYVSERVGERYLVELLPLNTKGDLTVNKCENIEWEILPDQFALKLTKGSGFNIICKNKRELDKEAILKTMKKWLGINNYYLSREPQYKGDNKIIAERLLEYNIKDYKFFCFGGEPFMFKVDVNRFRGHRANYYDLNWNMLDINEGGCPNDINAEIPRPKEFDEMVYVARALAKGWSFVRVDLYVHDGRVFFGEMTFHPAGGYAPLTPEKWGLQLGELIKL